MTVKITDELGNTFVYECETSAEAQKVVSEWLDSVDETPLYEITLTF